MKRPKPFLRSNLFACLLAFAAMGSFAGMVWMKIKLDPASRKSTAANGTPYEPTDSYQRPGTVGKLSEHDVRTIKRHSTVIDWTDDYQIVFQLNFPDDTRNAFVLIVRHQRSKFLFSALVDNRNDDWKNTLWLSTPMDENLEIAEYPTPFEIDAIRKLQWKFRKFEPYWNDPPRRNELLSRKEWMAAMTIALMRKEPVRLK